MSDKEERRIPACPLCSSGSPAIIRRDSYQHVITMHQRDHWRSDYVGDWDDDAVCSACNQKRPDLYVSGYGEVRIKVSQ